MARGALSGWRRLCLWFAIWLKVARTVCAGLGPHLQRLLDESFGARALLNNLPVKFRKFNSHLTFRAADAA